jgi:imidazolonepropionase-like amidohydrolase
LKADFANQKGRDSARPSSHSWQRTFPKMTKGMHIAAIFLLVGRCLVWAEAVPLAVTQVTVIDPASSSKRSNQTVIISGHRITQISEAPPPNDAKIIEGKGKFLVPGLCDMHLHLAGVSANPRWSRDTLLPLLIAHGVTTVRDMGGDLSAIQDWRKNIEAGKLIGPRIYSPGPMLDGGKSEPPALRAVSTPNEARRAVRDLKAKGVDFIKVLSRLDRESYLAIAEEAHKQNLSFVGHVPNSIRAAEASAAGQKSIEHIFYSNLTFDCSAREAELRKQSSAARAQHDSVAAAAARDEANVSFSSEKANTLWQTLIRNHTWVVPTLVAIRTIGQERELARSNPPGLAYLPAKLRQSWSPDEIEKEVSSQVANWYESQFETDLRLAKSMHAAGVRLMAGSDSLDPFNFPGPSLHEELRLLTEIGLTPMEALQAATSSPAEFLNGNKEWGAIQPGRIADLVLLDANPLEAIGNTTKISAVIVGGKCFDRVALDAMLAKARSAADQARE